LALVTAVLVAPRDARAQQNPDYQSWTALLGTANLDSALPGVRLWFDGHTRRGDAGNVFIFRPGVGYAITPWMSVWAGYAWIPVTSDATGDRFDEQRIWQQLILSNRWLDGRVSAQSRTRVEQRFQEGTSDLGHRVRQFVRADYRFENMPLGLVVWDELFWQLNDAGVFAAGFDQNRIFVGPALHAWDGFRVEFGYLNIVLERADQTLVHHALAINFFVAL
jgi:hypothetical protein